MSMHDKVTVKVGKYAGMVGSIVGIHGNDYSVRVDGVKYVQVYHYSELS